MPRRLLVSAVFLVLLAAGCDSDKGTSVATLGPESLPSWNVSASRAQILEFVERTTTEGDPDFVPVEERVAVFDNDGTLWSEQPVYFQLVFARDRIRAMAENDPGLRETEPYAAAFADDPLAMLGTGNEGLMKMVMAAHAGLTPDELRTAVEAWIAEAKHPRYGRRYTELVYRPMLELLELLRAHGYRTYIVSGGGVEFLRAWAEDVYGVPPEQVLGSTLERQYTEAGGEPQLLLLPELDVINDGPAKPAQISRMIGRRPVIAVGNSDGDYEMLAWTTAGDGPRLGLLIHHTDSEREWRYDRKSPVGRLERGLDDAGTRGWVVVDMKTDWNAVYPEPAR